jgi:DNA-binding transcriptional ArsR family regulator
VTLQQEARALGDPTRHAILRHLAVAPGPLGVDELTELLQLNHNATRQHLARLAAAAGCRLRLHTEVGG